MKRSWFDRTPPWIHWSLFGLGMFLAPFLLGAVIRGGGAGGTFYTTVENEGSPVPQRSTINFTGAGINCLDSGGKTVCTVSGGTAIDIQAGATLPLTCNAGPTTVDVFIDTDETDARRLFVCTTTDTWTQQGHTPEGLDVHFDISGGNTITGADETKPLTVLGSGGQASNGVRIYQHSSGVLVIACLVGGVENDCNKVVDLNTGFGFIINNNSDTAIFQVDETGALSRVTVDAEGANVSITRPFYDGGDLCGLDPSDGTTVAHIWNEDPLSTAPTPTARSGTNRGICVLNFPDSDGDYGVQLTTVLPDGFTGSFDADIWWDTTGTGNARFQIATKCYGDDEADDAAFNTASIVTAAAGTSGRPNRQTITGITTTGCAGGELMRLRFFRNRTEASDTLNAPLNVEKVRFKGRATE